MRVVLAVMMLWPITALAKPAPLPPGVTPSAAKVARGLYLHAIYAETNGPYGSARCEGESGEIWLYEEAGRAVMYSQREPCNGKGPAGVFRETFSAKETPQLFRPFSPTCELDLPGRPPRYQCSEGTVGPVPVRCRSTPPGGFSWDRECVSVEGRTRGMVLDRDGGIDDFSSSNRLDVDQIDTYAAIDPVVFEASRKDKAP